jgi:hypothetical protein
MVYWWRQLKPEPLPTGGKVDVITTRLAVGVLGIICALCVGGIVGIASVGHEPPPILGALASTCAGAVVGILVQTPKSGNSPDRQPHGPG